jgi:hypothetical protein
MILNKRNALMLALLPILAVVLGLAAFMYYHEVYVPAHEYEPIRPLDESPAQARVKWMETVASRNGKKEEFQGGPVDGGVDEGCILVTCFRKGEPAANCAAVVATGEREVQKDGSVSYRWRFKVLKPRHPDATIFVFMVTVSGERQSPSDPAIIEDAWGAYTLD